MPNAAEVRSAPGGKPRRTASPGAPAALLLALAATLPGQLSGIFTINPAQPASASNFTSLQAAVSVLMAQGVAGPVTFDLYDDAGPFQESHGFTTSNVNWSLQPPGPPGSPFPPASAGLVLGTWAGASATNRVTFRAALGEAPVIDATGRSMGVFWNGADFVTLDGLEIRGAAYDGVSIYSEASHTQVFSPVVRRCRIHGCGGSGVVLHGNVPPVQDAVIENCWFWNLQQTNAGGFNTISRFGYVSWRRQNGLRLRHNSFYVNAAAGNLFCAIGAIPGSLAETPAQEIVGNAVFKTAGAGRPLFMFLDIGPASGIPVVQDGNGLLDVTSSPFALHGPTANLVANTLADWRGATGRDPASIAADAAFVDPAQGDLHLGAASPFVDAATLPPGVADDVDGQPRAGTPDLGADERSSAGAPRVTLVGGGSFGSHGLPSSLGASRLPYLGNAGFTVDASGVLPGSFAWLFGATALAPSPIPFGGGAFCYLDPVSLLAFVDAGFAPIGPIPTGPAGAVSFPLPIPALTSWSGARLALQAAVLDPLSAPGFQVTNALDLVID